MVKNRQRKTCPKAKREKEILHDLDILKRHMKIVFVACEQETDEMRISRYQREYANLDEQVKKLTQELNSLWTANPRKKK